jgi:hypothetical protein
MVSPEEYVPRAMDFYRALDFSAMPVQMKVMLVAVLATILGAMLPWASAFGISVAGVRGDGLITLIIAFIGGALILANRGGAKGAKANAVAQLVLAGLVVVVALYHVTDEFAAIGVYMTLLAGLTWVGALAWWWFGATSPSKAFPGPENRASPLEPSVPAETFTEDEGGREGPPPT